MRWSVLSTPGWTAYLPPLPRVHHLFKFLPVWCFGHFERGGSRFFCSPGIEVYYLCIAPLVSVALFPGSAPWRGSSPQGAHGPKSGYPYPCTPAGYCPACFILGLPRWEEAVQAPTSLPFPLRSGPFQWSQPNFGAKLIPLRASYSRLQVLRRTRVQPQVVSLLITLCLIFQRLPRYTRV